MTIPDRYRRKFLRIINKIAKEIQPSAFNNFEDYGIKIILQGATYLDDYTGGKILTELNDHNYIMFCFRGVPGNEEKIKNGWIEKIKISLTQEIYSDELVNIICIYDSYDSSISQLCQVKLDELEEYILRKLILENI